MHGALGLRAQHAASQALRQMSKDEPCHEERMNRPRRLNIRKTVQAPTHARRGTVRNWMPRGDLGDVGDEMSSAQMPVITPDIHDKSLGLSVWGPSLQKR